MTPILNKVVSYFIEIKFVLHIPFFSQTIQFGKKGMFKTKFIYLKLQTALFRIGVMSPELEKLFNWWILNELCGVVRVKWDAHKPNDRLKAAIAVAVWTRSDQRPREASSGRQGLARVCCIWPPAEETCCRRDLLTSNRRKELLTSSKTRKLLTLIQRKVLMTSSPDKLTSRVKV